jgi:hypothetical protein
LTLRFALGVLILVAANSEGYCEGGEHFNVSLALNFSSAESTIELYTGLGGIPEQVASLRGSRIALATTAMIARRPLTLSDLDSLLLAVKYNQGLGDDVFKMRDARASAPALTALLQEVKRRNFAQRIIGTVQQLFPPDSRVSVRIPVFFVAFGPQTVDAFVRRVKWNGDDPVFVGEGEGEVTIVVNLAKAVRYGATVDEQLVSLMSVVAHEVFHAAFGAYKDDAPFWRMYYAARRSPMDQLMDLSQNEGIAYYLSLIQQTHGRLPGDWELKARNAMDVFMKKSSEMLAPGISWRRSMEILQESNTSGYWENYGCITGMLMAREIDNKLGSQELAATIAQGPGEFFRKYLQALQRGSMGPQFSQELLRYVQSLRY